MKKAYILILIFGAITQMAFGQHLKPNSTVQVNKTAFNTKAIDHNTMVVSNTKNDFINRKPKLSPSVLTYFGKKNPTSLLKAFYKVFTKARLEQLTPENGILINFYVNPQGKVLDVSFLLNTNTAITAPEIQQLETAIKDNVTFNLRPEETKGGDFFVITQVAKYRKVLDGSLE